MEVTGMQQVLNATYLFRHSPRTADWPSLDSLGEVVTTIDEMRAMTSSERRELLERAGVPKSAVPLFLRAIQSLAVMHFPENINKPAEDLPVLHAYRSATGWNPLVPHSSLIAQPIVLAAEPSSAFLLDLPLEDDFRAKSTSTSFDHAHSHNRSHSAGSHNSLVACNTNPPFPGLLNQGSTCYLNSILQSLYHLGAFNAAIMGIPTEDVVEPSTSIPLALQRLFLGMHMQTAPHVRLRNDGGHPQEATAAVNISQQRYGEAQTTTELTKSFGWTEQDAFIQHDAHELVRKLIDNMEEAVARKIRDGSMSAHPAGSPTSASPLGGAGFDSQQKEEEVPNSIRELFTGTLENYVDVCEVNYRSATNQIFYELQLVVKNHKSIHSSIKALLEPNLLEGKNKYCLERNGRKSYHDAKTGCRFILFPPVLMLHLARFDYDPIRDEMCKVSTRYEYYDELDLSSFTPDLPPAECQYQLHAVLVHNGRDANFGHYFCYVRCDVASGIGNGSKSARWIKFNDEQVTYASLSEVFGANFGGFTLNHWGSEVPQTKSAYMLIYVKKGADGSVAAQLLRGTAESEIPEHLKVRYRHELETKERLEREQREAHLYTKVHFITQSDLADHHQLTRLQHPSALRFPLHRTLRIENTAKALEAFQKYAVDVLLLGEGGSSEKPSVSDDALAGLCTFWYVSEEQGYARLATQVTTDTLVGSIAKGREMCVLVMPPTHWRSEGRRSHPFDRDSGMPEPISLEELIETSEKSRTKDEQKAPSSTASRGRQLLPEPSTLVNPVITHHYLYNPNNLKETYLQSLVVPRPPTDSAKKSNEERKRGGGSSSSSASSLPVVGADLLNFLDRRAELLHCVVFAHTGDFTVKDVSEEVIQSGVHYYWQLSSTSPFLTLYPTYDHFQEFLRTRISVELKSVTPPYASVTKELLSSKMPYEFVQRYFAIILNEPDFDKIRFSRHNPETNGPFFMKIKKNSGSNLEKLMTASKKLSKVLYYEILEKYTLSEIEASNPLSFDLFGDGCQYVSTHMILMPPPTEFTHATLLRSCLSEVMLPMSDAEQYHLLDIWKGRIYGVYAFDHEAKLSKPFEESAEYRLEKAPKPIDGVSSRRQIKVPVSHFHLVSNNKVATHGDPFYLYVSLDDTLEDLRQRIQGYLRVPEQAIQDWRLKLVVEDRTCPLSSTALIGDQITDFLKGKTFDVVESNPMATPFLGLEHAPAVQRRGGPARTTGNDLKIGT